MKWFKSELKKKFEMSDRIELHYCLGVEFGRNREARTITMNQRNDIKKVLKHFNMKYCKPFGIPFDMIVKAFG